MTEKPSSIWPLVVTVLLIVIYAFCMIQLLILSVAGHPMPLIIGLIGGIIVLAVTIIIIVKTK